MTWFQWLGTGGGAAAIGVLAYLWPTIQKMRAEAGKARVEAAVAADQADDAHWRQIVEAQTEALVKPLREEIGRLTTRVEDQDRKLRDLDERLERMAQRYRSAIGYVRLLLAWIRRHHHTEHPMDLPVAPSEIAGDI